jgi:hypothetical protein
VLLVKARLAIVAAVLGLVLTGAPEALADPIPLSPTDQRAFTARVGQIAFRARTAVIPPPGRMDFYVSKDNATGSDGVLSSPIDTFFAGPNGSVPPIIYEAGPGSDPSWPNRPDTYYWQAVYRECAFADPNCFGPIRSLTINPLRPPAQTSPADDATIPYGDETTFSVQDVSSYARDGTHIYIEFSKDTDRSSDGTFADRYLLARPTSVGGGKYEYRLAETIAEKPGTYHWMAERFDCAAEPDDCYVTDGVIRSFTVAPPVAGTAPNTILTRHPARRTRKRRARFAFSSSMPGASFQCLYTGGWSRCRSPQKFRHLKPGRYRFKVRAVANGKRDPTPAKWLFKVIRRHRGRH